LSLRLPCQFAIVNSGVTKDEGYPVPSFCVGS